MNAADGAARWADAQRAAALAALDGPMLGGVLLRARAGPVREAWLKLLRELLDDRPLLRLPARADPDRLSGGLDLAATLSAGRPVVERGLLQQADGGVLLVAMAERLDAGLAATIGIAMDTGRIESAVPGATAAVSVRFAVVALDEGAADDEGTPSGLADRLAVQLDLDAVTWRELAPAAFDRATVERARTILPQVELDPDRIELLCATALALGVTSMRAPLLAVRAACGLAALSGRAVVEDEDVATAVRLVLGPRAIYLPASAPDEDQLPPEPDPDAPDEPESNDSARPDDPERKRQDEAPDPDDRSEPGLDEMPMELILEAIRASVPDGLLEVSRTARSARTSQGAAGKSGAERQAGVRGRPAGVRRGLPGPNARLNLVETLRAAAPWQRLRRAEGPGGGCPEAAARPTRVAVRRDDFRVTRFRMRRETTTVFLVDASGSTALHRLAEAKGAVELLLADCYVRRDQVALISFRGTRAELLLPPTRSLVQAKRRLAELPGGGGTPLASGLNCALELCARVVRRGGTPVIVALTDGRANVTVDGRQDREQAHLDALAAARRLRAYGFTALLVDTSPRPRPLGRELAEAMGARYLPLPHADAARLSATVQAEMQGA